jgi:hypothetical protein
LIRLLEWGYNSDNLDLPQINLSVILNKEGDIPLSYEIYPCSVNDVVTLQDTVKRLHAMEFDQTQIVEVLDPVRPRLRCFFMSESAHCAAAGQDTRGSVGAYHRGIEPDRLSQEAGEGRKDIGTGEQSAV